MHLLEDVAPVPDEAFQARRRAALEALGRGVMVLPAARPAYRSRDTEYPYRPDSELYYLTGVTEPGAVAVLVGGDEPHFALFVPARDPDTELWGGRRLGPEEAAERFGADRTEPLSGLPEILPRLLDRGDRIHVRLGRDPRLDALVVEALQRARDRGPRKGTGPRGTVDPGEILDELRLLKDEHEIRLLRAAAELSARGHREGMRVAAPGVGEWEIQAAVEAAFRRGGATGPGFGTIVGSGPNACVLHYVANGRRVEDGDLVLLDAGAEVALYHGDITRTFPAGGRFGPLQAEVYDIVEEARAAAVARCAPGATLQDVHRAALEVLTRGLVGLGVLDGPVDDRLEAGDHAAWFPHRTSHWLGLDVHDPGDYVRGGRERVLAPGMVFTVEPGLYFRPEVAGTPDELAGIGVRIEDDVLITEDGAELLTGGVPTDRAAVAALVGG